jgi:hypothetical protein
MLRSPFLVSIPPSDNATEAAVKVPPSESVRVTPRADCRGVDGFCGETQLINGRKTARAV